MRNVSPDNCTNYETVNARSYACIREARCHPLVARCPSAVPCSSMQFEVWLVKSLGFSDNNMVLLQICFVWSRPPAGQ